MIRVLEGILINHITSLSTNIPVLYKNLESQSIVKTSIVFFSLLLVYNSLLFDYFGSDYKEETVWGHSFFGDNGNGNTLNATQTQQNENYVIDLFVNPSRPLVDRDINFTLEIKSKTGDELIELPVAPYIMKDGEPVFSNPNNYTLVTQGHYDFDHTFNETGRYSLTVDIKDIFYTLDIANFAFEIVVDDSVNKRIAQLIGSYYYLFIPIIIIIIIFALVNLRVKGKGLKDNK